MTVAIDFCFVQKAIIKFQRGIDCTVRKSRRQMPTEEPKKKAAVSAPGMASDMDF